MAKKKQMNFESAVERLEEITEQLESGESDLQEAIDLYTEGLEIAKSCSDRLREAENKIKLIAQKNDLPVEVDFGDSEEEA